tara:strand:+ start:1409 stop:1783 length:375 start_codon:yes stop_codon:yes gene_type:complete
MPTVVITFGSNNGNFSFNTSLQVGDIAYYVPTTTVKDFKVGTQANIVEIGNITAINHVNRTIDINTSLQTQNLPSNGNYIFFGKDNRVNLSTVLGYYASVKFVNDSTSAAELYTISSDIFVSSK